MKILLHLLLPGLLLAVSGCGSRSGSHKHIGFIQISEDPSLNEARQGVLDGLKEWGFEDGKNLTIHFRSASGDLDAIPGIFREFKSENMDLVITNSTPCMLEAARTIRSIPVVSTVCFSPRQMGIEKPPANLSGVYDPFDMAAFVGLVREVLPMVTRVGIPYHPHEPNAVFGFERLRDEFLKAGIQVESVTIGSMQDLTRAAMELAARNIQAYVVAADNTVHLGMDALVAVANEKKIPVLVTEPILVDRGASVGYGVDYYLWGKAGGRIAAGILNGVPPTPMQPLTDMRLAINDKACTSQGLILPASIKRKARNPRSGS